jgi:hypothetical protein
VVHVCCYFIVMLEAVSILCLLELVGSRCNIYKNTYGGYWHMIMLWRGKVGSCFLKKILLGTYLKLYTGFLLSLFCRGAAGVCGGKEFERSTRSGCVNCRR